MDLVIELKYLIGIANAQSHTHFQSHHPRFAQTVKEYVLPTLAFELNNKDRKTKQNVKSTMHNNVYKT